MLDKLSDCFDRWNSQIQELSCEVEMLNACKNMIPNGIKIDNAALQDFVKMVEGRKERSPYTGLFLSHMTNISGTEEVSLEIRKPLYFVGAFNKGKQYAIVGGAELYKVGAGMMGGSIAIEGNVGYKAGYGMLGGTIIIKGNAEDFLGEDAKGGKIIVKGNVNNYIGSGMDGAEIFIEGNMGRISMVAKKGKICQNGKCVWKDGVNI